MTDCTHLTRIHYSSAVNVLPSVLCGEKITNYRQFLVLDDGDGSVRITGSYYTLPLRDMVGMRRNSGEAVKACPECVRRIRCGCWPQGGQSDVKSSGTWCGDGSCPKVVAP